MQHVHVLRIACDVVLLPFLQEVGVEGSTDAGSQYHANG